MHVAPAGKPLPVDQVKELGDRSQGAGKTVEFKIYPGAPHGFHADYRGTCREEAANSCRKEAAKNVWAQMMAWFKKCRVLS